MKFCDTCEKCLDDDIHHQLLGGPVEYLFCNVKCLKVWVLKLLPATLNDVIIVPEKAKDDPILSRSS